MKNPLCLIMFFLIGMQLIFIPKSSANHNAGVEIYYDWINGNQYQVSVIVYRDCLGIYLPDSATICMHSPMNNFSDSIKIPAFGNPVVLPNFPYFPPYINACNGGTGYGIEKNSYSGIINLPFTSNDWIISYTGTRFGFSSTIPNPYEQLLYVETKIDNINYPQNASVRNGADPMFLYCVGQPAWENLLGNDPDGDSLQYSLISTLVDTLICPPQPYLSSILGLGPISSSIPFYIHPSDGWIHFIPDMVAVGVLSIKTDEYRNGNLINETTFTFFMSSPGGCIGTGLTEPDMDQPVINAYAPFGSEKIIIDVKNLSGKHYKISLIDVAGQVISRESGLIHSTDFTSEFSVSAIASGIYTIRFETEMEVLSCRFLK